MDQKDIDSVLLQQGLPTMVTLCEQIFNNGSFNLPLVKNLTARGIVVRITFGQEHADHCHIGIDPSALSADVSDKPFQVRWPEDIARILGSRGLSSTDALKFSSKVELRLLEGMTPRMLEFIMKELHSRQIFLQDHPSPEREQIVLNTAIEALGLPPRIQRVLLAERIYTLANLITWTPNGIADLAGLGSSSAIEIKRKLEEYGLQLNNNPFHGYTNTRSKWRV